MRGEMHLNRDALPVSGAVSRWRENLFDSAFQSYSA